MLQRSICSNKTVTPSPSALVCPSVFDHPTPAAADPTGESFCFEKGAAKHGGGDGFADVWKHGFFNERPAWLAACHAKLDAAVADAYGLPSDLSDEEILERLLALNLAAGKQ